eukprot:CAMPEP_0181533680 /NCGR_PEP_ID=MMETSP1110-20121109/73284_1 /TAXON_ID=174948 /ORGANISM="Symbiodinium sp., Strain CCMP421" /LENGTH=66 /DNA_ID=CAMNT_0023664875 /DNA_START=1 /DNA_END=198 /DNA_ORIENTATION=-
MAFMAFMAFGASAFAMAPLEASEGEAGDFRKDWQAEEGPPGPRQGGGGKAGEDDQRAVAQVPDGAV